ncbi:MAG: hypothetical protein ACI4RA_02340 [Kiritimatiellia bacterium]
MSAIRVKSSGVSAVGGAPLSNTGPKRKGGSPVPILLALVVAAAAGYFGWREYDKRHQARLAREAEYERRLAEKEARERAEAEAANRKPDEKKPEIAEVVEEKKPEPPPKKSAMEIWQAREAVRKDVLAKIAEARKNPEAHPLNGFAGIRFGEPLKDGAAVRWGTVLDEDAGGSVAARGTAFAVYGPMLKKPFMTFGTKPLVWVTPKTRRPYRIEFTRPLALKPGTLHEPETTNVVAFLRGRFKIEPFIPLPIDPEVKGCEFVFPMGQATVRVAEDGDILTFSVEREDIRAEAHAESETLRAEEKKVAEEDGKALDSRRYPHRPIDKRMYPGVKFKDETPRSFCGVVFASPPAESVKLVVPMQGPKGFFLDYEWAKCRPFRGFSRGRADVDSQRGGVYGVTLFSSGGTHGLDDKDYFESVRDALSSHYNVQPEEKKGAEGEFSQLTYRVGDLTITFGPDARGGFVMRAENQVLAELAKEEPGARRKATAR